MTLAFHQSTGVGYDINCAHRMVSQTSSDHGDSLSLICFQALKAVNHHAAGNWHLP